MVGNSSVMTPEFVQQVLDARAVVRRDWAGARCAATVGCDGHVAAGTPSCRHCLTAEERESAILLRRWAEPFVYRWLPHIWPACWFWPLPDTGGAHWTAETASLFDWQQGRCAICGWQEERSTLRHRRQKYGLVQDHDHTTGMLRGYLCIWCNSSEGHYTTDGRFLNYRVRPPAELLGIRFRYGRKTRADQESPGQLSFGDAF